MRLYFFIFIAICWLILILAPLNVIAKEVKFPYQGFVIQDVYQLDNGKEIYIEQRGTNDTIWEKDEITGELKLISHVWFFIALAKTCPDVDLKNVYFAQNKEHYLMGGIDENSHIRIFDLYNPKPWRDSDLGIVPNMDWAKEWCEFYKPLNVN